MNAEMNRQNKFPPLNELISLKGRKALVTGGAMGIGYAIAYRLAEAGAMVTVADRNSEKGQKAVEDLNGFGFQAFFQNCDVSDEESVITSVKRTIEMMGGIDILVNNAGIFPPTPLLETKTADIERIMNVNFKGLFYFTREVSRYIIEKSGKGVFINLASIDALHPVQKGMDIYDASKGAVLAITRSLAKDLAEHGIRVNAIAPGGILTEGALSQRTAESSNRSGLKEFLSRIPLGRIGLADDIGRVALFLASDLSSYMTGSLVVVDGGFLIS